MKSHSVKSKFAALASVSVLALAACGNADDSGEFPSRELTLVAAGGPGGGLDIASRQLLEGMEQSGVDTRVSVANDGAGNGNSARSTVVNRADDGYSVVVESNRIILNPMMGNTDLELDDFTVLAQLTTDTLVWAVAADSEYQSIEDVMEAVQNDPASVTFGVGTTPSNDQLNVLLPVREAGVEDIQQLNVVNFQDGGSLNTELLGGRIDVASTGLSEAGSLAESGDIRLLSVSSAEPLDGAAEGVPTWTELGYDVVVQHWRGVFGPADMSDEAEQWWIEHIEAATQTDTWEEGVDNLGLESDFVAGDEFREIILEEEAEMRPIFEEVGLVND